VTKAIKKFKDFLSRHLMTTVF